MGNKNMSSEANVYQINKKNMKNIYEKLYNACNHASGVKKASKVKGMPFNDKLEVNRRIYKQELYIDFIEDNPDFAPKAKMTVSRTRFYKWLVAYNQFKYECDPEEGKDGPGRWIRFRNKHELEKNLEIEF